MSEQNNQGFQNSRLIIKNLPKHLTEERMSKHFGADGKFIVTDSKIMRKGAKSR
jgi:RNA recognition motif-containing protein